MRRLICAVLFIVVFETACGADSSGPTVLNTQDDDARKQTTVDSTALPGKLRRSANRLVAEFVDGKRVDYDGLAASDAFKEYLTLAQSLADFDLNALETREDKLAFWINLYNAIVMHSVLASGVEDSVWERQRFFDRYAYDIGGSTFTPNQIEHAILRGERLDADDPRAKYAVDPPDPRIHFALNCGSAGCPAIGSYSADYLDDELDLATRVFVNSAGEVAIDERNHTIRLSSIFKWYADDFSDGVFNFLLRYLDEGETRDYLSKHKDTIIVAYNEYDWSLNH